MARTEREVDERLVQAWRELSEVQLELERERLRRRYAESLFEETLGAVSDGLILADAGGRVTVANDVATSLLRREKDDLVGKRIREVLGPGVPASPLEVVEHVPDGRLPAIETVVPSGRQDVPVTVTCAVLRNAAGRVTGMLCAVRDVTLTRRLLRQLERAETRWRLLAEIGDLLGREMDPINAIPEVARRVSEATGCAAAVILVRGDEVEDVILWGGRRLAGEVLHGLAYTRVDQGTALETVMREGRSVHAATVAPDFALLVAPAQGGLGQSAALVPISGKGTPVGALLLFSDAPGAVDRAAVDVAEMVAARVGLALANARLRRSLAESERARDSARTRQEMLAGVSHDMKTPLTVIQSSLAALQTEGDGLDPELRDRVVAAMSRQTHRMRSLVQQFLDYSRLEAGHSLTVHPRPTDVSEVVERAVATWSGTRPIEIVGGDGVPPALADPERLEQVLANLLSNAFKFSPPDSPVTISVEWAGPTVEVSVIDRGRGIDPSDLPHVFEKFHRGRGARATEGTGLGLYISRALVQAQAGAIRVSSRVGEGSRFTVSLPAAPGAAAAGHRRERA